MRASPSYNRAPQHPAIRAGCARGPASTAPMCGITGYYSEDPQARAALPLMPAGRAHRGRAPDGFHFDGPVGLGHRRLSVIDLALSRQPLLSSDGGIAV